MKLRKNNIFKKVYDIDGINIEVNYKILYPKSPNLHKDNLIVVLPGWSIDANSKTAITLGQAFAEVGNSKVLIIDTKPQEIIIDTLFKESIAINALLGQRKETELIIAGYSEGGIKAINLTTILQKNTKLNLKGLILMDSMGLYTHDSKQKLVGLFIKDAFIDTPLAIGKRVIIKRDFNSIKTGLQAGTDIIFGVLKEIKRSNLKYPKRMMLQINEMFSKSERLKEIAVPVILFQGIKDPVSNPSKVFPLDKFLEGGPHNPEREKFLKVNIFPNSPYIRLLVGKKALPHHAMPIANAEKIAKAALYLIEKANEKRAVGLLEKLKLFFLKRNKSGQTVSG